MSADTRLNRPASSLKGLRYFQIGWSPAPLGRLDVFYSAPPTVTGFYLIDALIARDFELSARR